MKSHNRPICGGVLILGILQRGCKSYENLDLGAKVRVIIQFLVKKMHEFEIIYSKRGGAFAPFARQPLPLHTRLHNIQHYMVNLML